MAVGEIIQGNLQFIVASIHLNTENEITKDRNKIENKLQVVKAKGILVAIDSKARSKTWHYVFIKEGEYWKSLNKQSNTYCQ
jgi:hypothetical protein